MILAMAECTEGPAHPDQGFEENRAVADVYNLLDYCWWMMKCEYL